MEKMKATENNMTPEQYMEDKKGRERQAIEKVRKIVDGLGMNSYLAAAMDGVLRMAENNVERNDYSSMTEQIERLTENLKYAKATEEYLQKQQLEPKNYRDILTIVHTKIKDTEEQMWKASERMILNLTISCKPEDYKRSQLEQSVKAFSKARDEQKKWKKIEERLQSIVDYLKV